MPHTTRASTSILSKTVLGLQRLTSGYVDIYQPGTAPERGYMRSRGVYHRFFEMIRWTRLTPWSQRFRTDPSELVRPVPDLEDQDKPF